MVRYEGRYHGSNTYTTSIKMCKIYINTVNECFAEIVKQNRSAKDRYKVGQIFYITKTKLKEASVCLRSRNLPNSGIDSYSDPGGGEQPSTPSPVCDSAFSEHHGCWPCEHHDNGAPPTPSSGRSSPRWDDDEDEAHHILTQGSHPYPRSCPT